MPISVADVTAQKYGSSGQFDIFNVQWVYDSNAD